MNGMMPAIDRNAPSTSSLPREGSRRSGSRIGARISTSTMTGVLIMKTEPHQKLFSSRPPTTGPRAAPVARVPLQAAMADFRCLESWNMLRIRAREVGVSVAAPSPSRAREPMSISGLSAVAASADATPKTRAPMISSFRRPKRSPTQPIVIRAPASTKL